MSKTSFIRIIINSFDLLINPSFSVLEACKYAGFHIPRFCYHELLSVAGNCRMCLVEVANSPKPLASCVTPVVSNMQIFLDTPLVLKARENVLESLLLNHPLDCPICDQGGECDLQDQAAKFGSDSSRYTFPKRGVENKVFSSLVSTIMTRCIHCTRCIRFSSEILGVEILGLLNRGKDTEVGNYNSKLLASELVGNIIDLCPVGALTSKSYSFKTRPWELRVIESIDLTDSFGSNVYISFKDLNIFRILPKPNKILNGSLLTDLARYFFDSLSSQRLFTIYAKKDGLIKSVSLEHVSLEKLGLFKKKSLVLVDGNLDLETLNLFKYLSFTYPDSIKLRRLEQKFKNTNNFYSDFQNNHRNISSAKLIFFLSSNLKLESAILNSKIRIKFIKEDLRIYKFGTNSFSNFDSTCINLNVDVLIRFIEGKNKKISRLLISSLSSLFIFGDSLTKRGFNLRILQQNLSFIASSVKVLKIAVNANSVGLDFSGVRSFTKNDLLKSHYINSISLKETSQLLKLLKVQNNSAWWNTHGPVQMAKVSKFLIPILPSLHEKGLYINLEERGQTTKQVFSISPISSVRYAFSIKKELYKLLKKSTINFGFFNFYYSMSRHSKLFDVAQNFKFTPSFFIDYISLSPIKLYIEDPFNFSKSSHYSKVLATCSINLRQASENFSVSLPS